jgi:hypothetical protein
MNILLLTYSSIYIISSTLSAIIGIRWINSMQNYVMYASGLIFPLSGLLCYSLPLMYYKYKGQITHRNTSDLVSTKDLVLMASFDTIGSLLTSYPISHLSIPIMNITERLTIIGIMGGSYIFLKRRYRANHYLGVFLTIYGVCLYIIPNKNDLTINGWLGMFMSASIPGIMSYLYKERALKKGSPDIWWLNTMICIYQLIIGIFLLPLSLLIKKLTFSDFIKQIKYGTICQFTGNNVLVGDDCQYALLLFIIFSILDTIVNIVMLAIIRDSSSIILLVTSAVKTPLIVIFGSISFLAGSKTKTITVIEWFSLIILLIGSIVYNWANEITIEESELNEYIMNDIEDYEEEYIF